MPPEHLRRHKRALRPDARARRQGARNGTPRRARRRGVGLCLGHARESTWTDRRDATRLVEGPFAALLLWFCCRGSIRRHHRRATARPRRRAPRLGGGSYLPTPSPPPAPRPHSNRSNRNVAGSQVITRAVGTAVVIYLIVATAGYITFGDNVMPDILNNYPGTKVGVGAARLRTNEERGWLVCNDAPRRRPRPPPLARRTRTKRSTRRRNGSWARAPWCLVHQTTRPD